MRILELCVILLEKKKNGRRKSTPGWNYTSKVTPPVPKAGVPSCATAFPRFPCRNFSRQFVYEGGKRVRGGVFSSPLPPLPPPPRNFFNIRIRVGPPTRAQSLPRRRRLSLFRVRERNFSSRKTKPPPHRIHFPFQKPRRGDQSPDNFSTFD